MSTAALLRSLTTIARHGLFAVVVSSPLYVVTVLVAAALFLNQLASQAGPLSASLPVISPVDPLVSVVVGVLVFDEAMRHGPPALVSLVVLGAVLAAAAVVLSRSSALVGTASPREGRE